MTSTSEGRDLLLTVEGMSCRHCEQAVERAVGKLPGVMGVSASAPQGQVRVTADSPDALVDAVALAIEAQGFTVVR